MGAVPAYAKELNSKKPSDASLIYIDTPEVRHALATRQEAGRAEINVGHACPHKCIFCMQGHGTVDQKQWVPLEKMKAEIEHYRFERGFTRLGFLGGEPSVYPWIVEALAHARQVGFTHITINTNGFHFADFDLLKRCVEAGLTRMCMSVHGHTAAVEDTCSGSEGSLVRKVQAIRNFRRLQREGHRVEGISLNPVLNRLNMVDIPGFVDFFFKLRVLDIRFNYIRPEGRTAESREIVPAYAEAMPYVIAAILNNEREWHHDLTFGEIPQCVWPEEFWTNDYLRNKYVGEFRDTRTIVTSYHSARKPAGEDGHRRFVWQELKAHVLKSHDAPGCKRCDNLPVCGGVWRNYLNLYGHKEFRPIGLVTVEGQGPAAPAAGESASAGEA